MFNYLISGIAGLALLMGGTGIYFDRQDNLEKERLGLATYKSIQVGGSPTADYILSTDGTDSTWIANAGGGGGGTGTVGTSTSETAGGVPYWTSTSGTPALLGEVASTSIAAGTGLSFTGTLGALLGGVSGTLNAEVQTSDLHDAVTLSGALNYITLVGQDIVRGFIDLTADVTGVLPNANVAEDLTITAGTIENTPIGASTPSTAKFTNSTSTGSIYTGTKNLSNYADFYNGTFAENFNALVMSDGVTASTTITSTVGSTLTLRFSDGDTATTTPLVIELTAGSDASPQANYIYIPQSTKSLTKSTTAWPDWTTEFIKIGYFLCPSLSTIQTNDGCYINQNWNDGNGNGSTVDKGHLVDLTYRSRLDGAKYFSGIDGNGDSSTYLVITAGNVELKSTAGVILQMHPHTFPAFDTSAGDEVLVKNWSGDAYHNITNLNDITADSTGGSTSGKWMNLVIWGVGNKGADNYEPVMINLPACSYNNQASAEQDVSGCDDFTMPREFNLDSSTGFLISRITVRDQATWSYGSAVDLRGTSPSVATGGASGVATNFADNTFSIFDETTGFANTFQLSGLSADRLITTPDAAGTMTLNGRTDTNYLLDNADDISSGSLTATEFIASDATATSTFAGGLAIETSGLVYDFTSNNVGIGTASPVVPLDVNGSISSLALFVDDLTLNGNAISSSGASSLTLTATAGQAVAVEGVSFDGGVVTGASSISSTGFTGALTGNADTATALAANGGNCVAGSYPLGVDASGAVESCTDATTEINSAISTHAGVAAAHQALVTLAGTPNYLTLSGQAITLAKLDITDDTNLIAGTNITLSTNTLNVDDAFLINDGDDTTTGQLTAANFVASSASATSTFAGGLTVDTSKFFVDPDAGRVGVGTAAPEALIFEMAGAAVGGSPNASGDDVIIRGFNVGLSFLSPNTNQQTVLFGDADDNDIGGFFYTHTTDAMTLRTNGIQSVLMDSTNSMTLANGELIVQGTGVSSFVGNVGIGTTSPSTKLDIVGAARTEEQTEADGATITFDLATGNQHRATMAGNRIIALSNETTAYGQPVRIVLCQDGTGTRVPSSWDANILWAGGTAPTLTTTSGKCDVLAGFVTQGTGTPRVLLDKVLSF